MSEDRQTCLKARPSYTEIRWFLKLGESTGRMCRASLLGESRGQHRWPALVGGEVGWVHLYMILQIFSVF